MPIRRAFFANYEALVLKVARVVLIVLATVSFLAIPSTLIWMGITLTKPTEMNYKKFLYVPTYESISSTWNSQSSVRTEDAHARQIPPIMNETFETIDSLYQIVGREEQKFSESYDLQQFYTTLIEPFMEFEEPNDYDIDFLLELKQYTLAMVGDEMLKRIADSATRTNTLVDIIFKFRDEYLINFDSALATVDSRATATGWTTMVTSLLALQVLSVCITVFVVSTVSLLGFHVGLKRQSLETALSRSNENDEDN